MGGGNGWWTGQVREEALGWERNDCTEVGCAPCILLRREQRFFFGRAHSQDAIAYLPLPLLSTTMQVRHCREAVGGGVQQGLPRSSSLSTSPSSSSPSALEDRTG